MPLRLGTCSWSEKSWVGPFYPPGTKPGDYLWHYATVFSTVEADSTYYARPSVEIVRGWAEKTPESFALSCKMSADLFLGGRDPRRIDPDRLFRPTQLVGEVHAFHASLSLLGPRLGPVVIQCPWFHRDLVPGLAAFLARLGPFQESLPASPRRVLKVRNREFLHEELLAMLRHHQVALCLSEVRGMPHPADQAQKLELRTTDFFYARLIGDRSAVERVTKTFDRVVLDKSASLDRWAGLIRVTGQDSDGFVYVNNHFAGHGPETVRGLNARLQG